jgi:topoisomerase-4 subunit A
LYLNRKDGFAGYALKKDEPIEKCSDLDDVLVIGKDGVMKVMKIADKMFVGKTPLKVSIFRRDDQKVYNMVYRDGKSGRLYAKKFKIGGVTRDKEYPLFKTHSKSRIFFFAVHDTEKKNSRILVHLDPDLKRIKEMVIEFDFAWLEVQGRSVKGSTLTAHKVDRVVNAPKSDETEDEVTDESPATRAQAPKAATPREEPSPVPKEELSQVVDKIVPKDEGKKTDPPPSAKEQATFDF